jgi:hypothetical protein
LKAAITRYKERKEKKKREKRKNGGINHFARQNRSEIIVEEEEEEVEEAGSTKDCVKDFETRFTIILFKRDETKTKEDKKHKRKEGDGQNTRKILKRTHEERLHRGSGKGSKSIVTDIGNPEGNKRGMESNRGFAIRSGRGNGGFKS